MCLAANAVVAAASIYLAVAASDGARLGLARSDDLPYGELVRLDRTGAVIWLVVAIVGIVAAYTAHRPLLILSAGLWTVLTLTAAVVVIGQGNLWGLTRPGDVALSLGLALSAAVGWLDLPVGPGSIRP